MRKLIFFFLLFLFPFLLQAQKKILDHAVYDAWETVGEKIISDNGQWVVYTVEVQEGDSRMVIARSDNSYRLPVPRGYNARFTSDSRYVIFAIKPLYADIREAKIKKAKPEDLPKDSLGIAELGKDSILKIKSVTGYKIPENSKGWMAYMTAADKAAPKDGAPLILHHLSSGNEITFHNISGYQFDKSGRKILLYKVKKEKDSADQALVLYYDMNLYRADTLSRGGADFSNFSISGDGTQVAYTAQRDSSDKALQRFYKLWYFKEGMDSAVLIVDHNTPGMQLGMTVSENGETEFSKTGNRLFFGTAAIPPPKDTLTPDIDKVSVDIWNYKDDYLQPVQLARLQRDLRENYLAVYQVQTGMVQQLGSREIPAIYKTMDGDGEKFVGVTDFGKRIESQWTGTTKKDIYAIDVSNGNRQRIKENLDGVISPSFISYTGKYICWFDNKTRQYWVWDGKQARNLSQGIKTSLADEENDVPADPPPYGIMGWQEGDSAVYLYDRYDIWKADPDLKIKPMLITAGRSRKLEYRFIKTDEEQKFFSAGPIYFLQVFDERDKSSGLTALTLTGNRWQGIPLLKENMKLSGLVKAKKSNTLLLTKESFIASPDVYSLRLPENFSNILSDSADFTRLPSFNNLLPGQTRLSAINPQQNEYNWGTAELFHWKAYDGKESAGIIYKPEDFDPKKKYPMICYFYEQLSNTLHNYYPPSPIRSAINIPFYTSRGYVIFVPDIRYKTGYPGQSAYNYVVSGARAVVKKGYVDSTRMAIQGHSWGGYQVAYLITRTNLFKAAWAGAPVANMTSAYGGIRWETGLNRQFQYEKTQSRIGGTLWDKRNLYIENSPLFFLDKVKTPVVIMHNDADGAVPWYQGIEMFTGLRRLGKKVWMLNYNGEGHGLTIRKDKLDYQIRMQQFFDWILKGERPAKWITEGVPAVDKGKDRGLELVEEEN